MIEVRARRRPAHTKSIALLATACGLFAQAARADAIQDFYRTHPLTFVVGHEPGTGFDLYARTLSRHWSQYMPGAPAVIVQNMVGASGLVATNWLYNVAPKDGTVIATFAPTAPLEPLLGVSAARFEAQKLNWIGNVDQSVALCGVWRTAGIEKFDDLFTKEILVGGTGAGGPLASAAHALRNLVGVKTRLVDGYKGSVSVRLAILQGEIQGVCGMTMGSMNAQYMQDIRAGDFKYILQFGVGEHPALPGVPPVYRYAKTAEDRQTFDLVFGAQAISRPFAAPPGTPAERVAALRKAFDATVRDPAFAADIEKQQLDLNPMNGEELQALFQRLYASPKEVVERAKAATKAR